MHGLCIERSARTGTDAETVVMQKNPSLEIKAPQLRELLKYARNANSVDIWAEVAMIWIELASEYIDDVRDRELHDETEPDHIP